MLFFGRVLDLLRLRERSRPFLSLSLPLLEGDELLSVVILLADAVIGDDLRDAGDNELDFERDALLLRRFLLLCKLAWPLSSLSVSEEEAHDSELELELEELDDEQLELSE